jgi:hypothetical protein
MAARRARCFAALLDEPGLSAYEAVRATWKPVIKGDFRAGWRKALHDGWIGGTRLPVQPMRAGKMVASLKVPAPSSKDSLEIIFRPDPNIYDGRWSNVGWLQELPKPVTNLSWDNAALVSGATLTKLGLGRRRHYRDHGAGRKVKAPVIVRSGASGQLGHRASRLRPRVCRARGLGRGIQCLPDPDRGRPVLCDRLIEEDRRQVGPGDYQEPLPGSSRYALWPAQGTGNNSLEADEAINERGIIRYATLEEYKANPGFANEGEGREKTGQWTRLCSPTGSTTKPTPGACRST